jgi:hypothetical protein
LLYQRRNAPLLSGDVMDSAQKGFAIFAAAASGLFVLWQWLKQRGQGARSKGLTTYIRQVAHIEERAMEGAPEQALSTAELGLLRDQLGQLKTRALTELARGELAGNELFLGFLAQVADVRDAITRRMQQRGDSEEPARSYPRSY